MKFYTHRTCRGISALHAILLLLLSCTQKAAQDTLFSELKADETGLDFVNSVPEQTPEGMNIIQYLYYYNGGGVAVGDLNNDGLPDLYFTANLGENQIYLNKGHLKFENITRSSGASGSVGAWKTGVSMVDINADGWLDIYVCQVGNYKTIKGKNQLFINQLRTTGGIPVFKEMAADYGLDCVAFCTQAAFFDYDHDADLDCFLLNHSVHSPESYKDTSISRQYDALASDRLLRCERSADGRTFYHDVSVLSGLHDGKSGYGLGLALGDMNADNQTDIYVTNDFHENDFLYYGVEHQKFKESIVDAIGHSSNFSMGCDVADFNNDALPDIISLDMKPEDEFTLKASAPADPFSVYQFKHAYGYHWQFARNCLQMNVTSPQKLPNTQGNRPRFFEIGQYAGIAATDWSWSALFCDLDQDGWKDLYITNGIPHRPNDMDYNKFRSDEKVQRNASDLELVEKMPSGKAANYAFRNNGQLHFENVASSWGLDQVGFSNGAVYADLDVDGDLDLVTNNLNAPATILRNNSNQNNWVRLQFTFPSPNTFAIGTKAYIYASNTVQYFENQPTRGFQSCVEPGVFSIALGQATQADSIVLVWPNGKTQTLKDIPAGQVLQCAPTQNDRNWFPQAVKTLFKVKTIQQVPDTIASATDLLQFKLLPWSQDALGCKFTPDGKGAFFNLSQALLPLPNGQYQRVHRVPKGLESLVSPANSCFRSTVFAGEKWCFIGNRFASGAYGYQPKLGIFIEKNDTFSILTQTTGNVSDAQWADVNGDNRPDLIMAGEWENIKIILNLPNQFKKTEIPHSEGLWQSLQATDLDGDGDTDLVAGNLGLNTNLRASEAEPLGLLASDFDRNGDPDPILSYYRQGKNYVFADKDLLVSQLPFLKKQFVEYSHYAKSSFEAVFTPQMSKETRALKAVTTASCWFENKSNGKWEMHELPDLAQFAPVMAILAHDFNRDGKKDLLLAGNMYDVQPAIGRFDASAAWLLLGEGGGHFRLLKPADSGIWIEAEVRDLHLLDQDKNRVLVVRKSGYAVLEIQ